MSSYLIALALSGGGDARWGVGSARPAATIVGAEIRSSGGWSQPKFHRNRGPGREPVVLRNADHQGKAPALRASTQTLVMFGAGAGLGSICARRRVGQDNDDHSV